MDVQALVQQVDLMALAQAAGRRSTGGIARAAHCTRAITRTRSMFTSGMVCGVGIVSPDARQAATRWNL